MFDMNIFDFLDKTSFLVKMSILLLIFLSVISWSIIFNRIFMFNTTQRALKIFEKKFWSGIELSSLYQEISAYRNKLNSSEKIFYAGFKEFSKLYQTKHCSPKLITSRTSHIMHTAIYTELKELENHIPLIGTIGSISPYIGLLGTVLGILNVFIELSKPTADNVNNNQMLYIHIVAPGIAEALISTAIGLFVAIPSVMAFNYLNVKINNFNYNYHNFTEEFVTILYHQISSNFNSDSSTINPHENTILSKISNKI